MFQTKIVWVGGGHKRVLLIWPWVSLLASHVGVLYRAINVIVHTMYIKNELKINAELEFNKCSKTLVSLIINAIL